MKGLSDGLNEQITQVHYAFRPYSTTALYRNQLSCIFVWDLIKMSQVRVKTISSVLINSAQSRSSNKLHHNPYIGNGWLVFDKSLPRHFLSPIPTITPSLEVITKNSPPLENITTGNTSLNVQMKRGMLNTSLEPLTNWVQLYCELGSLHPVYIVVYFLLVWMLHSVIQKALK